jgi:SAM-dependent methyltransferase
MAVDFSKRSFEAEWLDGEGHDNELPHYLTDLAWLNATALGHWVIIRWLRRAVRSEDAARPFTLLDAGCGDGSLLRAIDGWAHRAGVRLDLIGIDLDAATIDIARARTPPKAAISFEVADVFAFEPQQRIDFIVSSLLAHHLTDERIPALLRWMDDTAALGWLIYDLQRSAIPYHALGALSRIARLHPMVVHDGRISVRRALSRAEWRACIAVAGLQYADVRTDWFFYRLLVSRLRARSA